MISIMTMLAKLFSVPSLRNEKLHEIILKNEVQYFSRNGYIYLKKSAWLGIEDMNRGREVILEP